jgi:superfamily II DNA or RNA helicase
VTEEAHVGEEAHMIEEETRMLEEETQQPQNREIKLYEWQKSAIARFARAAYFALVVDCGLGKTIAAIQIALRKKLPTLVIAPGHTLCNQWRDEILRVVGPDEQVWVHSKPEETKNVEKYREEFAQWLSA